MSRFLSGDLGIADAIHKAQFAPVIPGIIKDADKKTFVELQTPNRKTGLWAVERTFITTALETQKPYIEMAKTCLELFGQVEMTLAMLSGGPNPKTINGSFINTFQSSSADMAKFKTGYEPKAPPASTEGELPESLYLGKFRRNSPTGDVFALDPDPQGRFQHPDGNWPQYQNYDEYYNEQVNEILIPKIQSLEPDMYQAAFEGRVDSIGDEWGEMESEAQLAKVELAAGNLKRYYKPLETTYLGKPVFVDVEDLYDIDYSKSIENPDNPDEYYEVHTVTAVLKEGAAGSLGKFPPFFQASTARAARNFARKVIEIIVSKYIPVLISLQKIIDKPVEFVGDIFTTKIKEHFEMLDLKLKDKDKHDPDRMKYWSGDKFVLDGLTLLNVGLLNISFGLDGAVPSFKVGQQKPPDGNNENALVKMALNLVAMPINFLKGIFDIFKNLVKNLFKLNKLPSVVPDFLSLKAFKELVELPKLLEFLGAKDGDIKTIPMLNIPKAGNIELVPQMIAAFLKFIVQFINGFIGMPNTIINVELVPQLPVP